jgi:phosphohistidine phosphatase
MRRLFLFRHATAERGAAGTSDKARELTPDGREDAAVMGRYMARHRFTPDAVLISPSTRTRETWDVMKAAVGQAARPEFDDRIYDASAQALLAVLKSAPADVTNLMLIGHNPGTHELAVLLMATGDIDTRERLREKFPTSALAVFDFALKSWSDLHPRSGRLERFVSPKTITAATN